LIEIEEQFSGMVGLKVRLCQGRGPTCTREGAGEGQVCHGFGIRIRNKL